MLSDKEKNELLNELNNTRQEISQIKNRLNSFNRDKEHWFTEKERINQAISEKISGVKGKKIKRNELTTHVKELKTKREELNSRIKVHLEELRQAKTEYVKMQEKLGLKEDPYAIKKRMERIEYTIETEPMSFDKEKALMKELKKLKKSYSELKGLSELSEKEDAAKKQVRVLRKDAAAIHRQIQESATESQVHHETFIGGSTEIKDLKQSEEDAYKKFFEFKKKYTEAGAELKEKLAKLQTLREQLEHNNVELETETKENLKKILEEKEKTVEEKIKKSRKLTTEDILILQAKETLEEQATKKRR